MFAPGTTVSGRYRITALVGSGGMGTVYRARDEHLGREVALKVLRADLAADPKARTRFLREGQIAAQIAHPNVVRTFDAGDTPAGPYLVQEFLIGQTLDHLIPLPPARAAVLAAGVAAALDAIHRHGYIHCDVKPGNVLVKADGTPVLLDFGIARAEGIDTTTLIGTPHYLAPERAQGAPATVQSDLYALGIVLYQAISGQLPFAAPSVPAIIQQHLTMPVPPLPIVDSTGPVLDRVIAQLTAKRPGDRYPSAAAAQADLLTVARGDIHAQPTAPVAPLAARVVPAPAASASGPLPLQAHAPGTALPPRRLTQWWAAALVLAALVLLIGFSLARGRIMARRQNAAVPAATSTATTPALATTPATAPAAPLVVPELVGLQFEAARSVLQERGLDAALGEQRDDPHAAGTVLASDPPANTPIGPNSQVLLSVSVGPAQPPLPLVDNTDAQNQGQDQPRDESGEKQGEAAKKQEEQQREAAKKQEEQQREAAKKQEEQQREAAKKQEEQQREAAKKQEEKKDN